MPHTSTLNIAYDSDTRDKHAQACISINVICMARYADQVYADKLRIMYIYDTMAPPSS